MSRFEQHLDESGELHRIGGPAVIYSDGSKFWCRHGKRHRRGGSAFFYPGGWGLWYINDHPLHASEQLPERAHGIMELFL